MIIFLYHLLSYWLLSLNFAYKYLQDMWNKERNIKKSYLQFQE